MTIKVTQTEMVNQLVRYDQLRPCTTAFIDTRTPGSERKENFTIIGPGVAENPEQHVHISIPHGFNIGGARQPPGCVNSQHSHETAEVFVVHSGYWRFKTGHDGRGASIDLGPGDTISIPLHVFRGFENIGQGTGFLFAVLGGDDPGHVTWAPYVFEAAARYGLVLLESGRLVDTAKEAVPAGAKRMPVTTVADLSRYRTIDTDTLASCVLTTPELRGKGGLTAIEGFMECPVVGVENPAEQVPAAKMGWAHGFQVRALQVEPQARCPAHRREEEEVLLMHAGTLRIEWHDGHLDLRPGDTLTVPKGLTRSYLNNEAETAVVYVVRGGDHPQAAQWMNSAARAPS